MKSSENNCKHAELAEFDAAELLAAVFTVLLQSFNVSNGDDLYGVDVKTLQSNLPPPLTLPIGDGLRQIDDALDSVVVVVGLNVVYALWALVAGIFGADDHMSIGDKSCGRNKLTSGEKLSADRFKIDDAPAAAAAAAAVPLSHILSPLLLLLPLLMLVLLVLCAGGDCICGGVNQTVLLESFFIISDACDNLEFGVSHRLAGVDVDFLNWFFDEWSRWVLFGDDCVEAQTDSLLVL